MSDDISGNDKPCPNCGYCPHCGQARKTAPVGVRRSPYPSWPHHPYYWQTPVSDWPPNPRITCSTTRTVPNTTVFN